MATGVVTFSKTAATNATADSAQNWAEGQAPSSVNDSARAGMASVAKWRDDLNGSLATTGGTTAYAITTNQSFAALTAGYQVAFQMNATNTGTTTLAVDGLTAKPLRSAAGVELLAGSLLIGAIYKATYFTSNSGEWIVESYPVLGDAQIVAAKLASNAVTTAKIADDNVTLAKLVNASAQYKVLGRKTTAAGDWEECSISEILDFAGLGDGSSADGDILYRDTTWKSLPKGSNNQVLTLAAGLPSWATPAWAYRTGPTLTASGSTSTGGAGFYTYSDTTAPTTTPVYRKDDVTVAHTSHASSKALRVTWSGRIVFQSATVTLALFRDAETTALDWALTQAGPTGTGNGNLVTAQLYTTTDDTASHTYHVRMIDSTGGTASTLGRRTILVEEAA